MSVQRIDGNANAIKQQAAGEIERRRPELIDLSLRIHATPEVAFQEHESSAMLADFLETAGFAVERGICEIDTAFRATCGSGEPRIAFVAEYDALPGIGHGCGHNIIGTAAAAAGIAVKSLLQEAGGGTVLVIGTPAEEVAGGKVYMVARGAFDGVDCALMVHPGNRNTAVAYSLACLELDLAFRGKAAPAAARVCGGSWAAVAALTDLAIGPLTAPPSPSWSQATPLPPSSWARALRPSKKRRDCAAPPGTARARTTPPDSTTCRKARNSASRKRALVSCISRPKRRSGLSVP